MSMHQQEINNDLKSYINDRKKSKPFWQRVFRNSPRSKTEVQEEIKEDLEEKAAAEENALAEDDKKELHEMEAKIEEVNTVEERVEEEIEEEHEGVLKRFFKKLHHAKPNDSATADAVEDDANDAEDESIAEETPAVEISEEEIKTLLKNMHDWILELPPEKLQEFKRSEDFELYTKALKHYKLIK